MKHYAFHMKEYKGCDAGIYSLEIVLTLVSHSHRKNITLHNVHRII